MQHFPDDDTSTVTAPEIRYHQVQPIRITAEQGLLARNDEQIQLVGRVLIERMGRPGGTAMLIQTRELTIFPQEERATTHSAVSITQGATHASGSGLDVDNKNGIAVLHGRVAATIHRNQRS